MGETTIPIFNGQQWALCELMSLRNNPSQTENSRPQKTQTQNSEKGSKDKPRSRLTTA